jgi:hypothetical protein
MSGARRCVVYAALAVICAGSLVDLATDSEHWPFSQYAMYSDVKREPYELRQLRLFGVPAAGEEFALRQFEYIQPFDQVRLRLMLSALRTDPRRQPLLTTALQDCLTRYETLRRAGRHSGPPLAGVRLYELHWRLDPWARNADRPDSRTLVLEVPRSQPEREPVM